MSLPKCIWNLILKQANWFPARGVNRMFRGLVDAVYVFKETDFVKVASYSTTKILNLYAKHYEIIEDDAFYYACIAGNMEVIKTRFCNGITKSDWSPQKSHKNGYLEPIISLVVKGANKWNFGLKAACSIGYLEMAQLMIDQGAKLWNLGLCKACRYGHLELAQLMIHKGAYLWNYGLKAACKGGHLQLVNLMIEKGANDWDSGLQYACRSDQQLLVYYMILKGANVCLHCGNTKHTSIKKIDFF